MGIRIWIFLKNLLSLASISFVIVFNTAGGVSSTQAFNEDAPLDVYETAWSILQVRLIITTASQYIISDTWTGYLFLNNACIGPDAGYSSDGELGPQCLFSRGVVAQTYDIRVHPTVTTGSYGPGPGQNWTGIVLNAICASHPTEYQEYNPGQVFIGCWAQPDELSPEHYSVDIAAPWAFYLLGAIMAFVSMLASWRFCGPRPRPQAKRVLRVLAWCEVLSFLIASAVVTGQARAAAGWVNAQHSAPVSDARLSATFFGMSWALVFFPLLGMALQFRIEDLERKARSMPPPYVEEINLDIANETRRPPAYETPRVNAWGGLINTPG